MEIQDKIRLTREQFEWTQEEMAEKLNMSPSGYAKIERGETKLHFDKLQQVANIFNMSIADLVGIGERKTALWINEHGDNHEYGNNHNANYYIGSESVLLEAEKLKLTVQHKDEIIRSKDDLLRQQAAEIAALKRIIALLET